MLEPTVDSLAALARSSPWRWTTLRFTLRWERAGWPETVRARVRRPDRLRVETLDGALVQVVHERPSEALPPVLRADGLVAERPRDHSYDDPMYLNYFWVALLDPAELADGVEIDSVAAVEHGGRPAWEAVVRTTSDYEPRCGCCSLLRSPRIDLLEYGLGAEQLLDRYPDAYRVRLDVQTGVCVLTEPIGQQQPAGHDVRIEAVDEPMDDALFVRPRRGPFRRRPGWAPLPQ